MASPVVIYFAGIGTVVTALSVGFAGAMVLTYTTPVEKVGPAAFEKPAEPTTQVKASTAPQVKNPVQAAVQSLAYAPPRAQPEVTSVTPSIQTTVPPSAGSTASAEAPPTSEGPAATALETKSVEKPKAKSVDKKISKKKILVEKVEKRKLRTHGSDQKTKYAGRNRDVIIEITDGDESTDGRLSYDAPSTQEVGGPRSSLFGFLSDD